MHVVKYPAYSQLSRFLFIAVIKLSGYQQNIVYEQLSSLLLHQLTTEIVFYYVSTGLKTQSSLSKNKNKLVHYRTHVTYRTEVYKTKLLASFNLRVNT